MLIRIILISLFLAVSVLTITVNAIILILIMRKKKLHQVRFYIIADMAFADIVSLLILFNLMMISLYNGRQVEENVDSISAVIAKSIGFTLYVNSILTTILLAIARYIAVKYNLRYQSILSKRRIIFLLIISWLLSAILSGVVWIDVSVCSDLYRNDLITFIILRFIASLLLLGLSKYTYVIRKQHMEITAQRKDAFGIEKEKFDRLKIIKGSLEDSFKFYVINVIMMSIFSSIETYELVFTEFHFDIKLIVALLLQLLISWLYHCLIAK